MTTEGIWKSEVYGLYGWESHGVLKLEKGQLFGGDDRQFTTGSYKQSENEIEANLEVNYFGMPRTMFGCADRQFTTKMAGKLDDGVITGLIARHDKPHSNLPVRLTRHGQLPTVEGR